MDWDFDDTSDFGGDGWGHESAHEPTHDNRSFAGDMFERLQKFVRDLFEHNSEEIVDAATDMRNHKPLSPKTRNYLIGAGILVAAGAAVIYFRNKHKRAQAEASAQQPLSAQLATTPLEHQETTPQASPAHRTREATPVAKGTFTARELSPAISHASAQERQKEMPQPRTR